MLVLFQYATEELKGDREIVLAAVSENGLALNLTTNGLKADEEMMRHALEQSPDHLVGLKGFPSLWKVLRYDLPHRRPLR